MYAITGATGNTGRVVAEALLTAGKDITVIGRSKERLKPLVQQGGEAFVGNLEDAQSMTIAFSGALGAYCLVPPQLDAPNLRAYQRSVGESLAAAVHETGVRYVVFLSSVGAHLAEGTGPITGLRDVEDLIAAVKGVNVLNLRAAYFMENLLVSLSTIDEMGVIATPLRGDLAIPMIATRDIGAIAAERLLAMDFAGVASRELLGPRDITLDEAATVIGDAIGKRDLGYLQLSYEEAEKVMREMGISADTARRFTEMYRAYNEERIRPEEERSPTNTTSTTLEAFARIFADVYRKRRGR